jgi:hypothetical protein
MLPAKKTISYLFHVLENCFQLIEIGLGTPGSKNFKKTRYRRFLVVFYHSAEYRVIDKLRHLFLTEKKRFFDYMMGSYS